MREVVDGVLYDTEGAQFVTGYKARRRRRRSSSSGSGGSDRPESGTMYVMWAGGKKRIFLVERPATGEALAEPIDAATARIVVDEWRAAGRITGEAARMALSTLDMVAPAVSDVAPARAANGDTNGGGSGSSGGGRNGECNGGGAKD